MHALSANDRWTSVICISARGATSCAAVRALASACALTSVRALASGKAQVSTPAYARRLLHMRGGGEGMRRGEGTDDGKGEGMCGGERTRTELRGAGHGRVIGNWDYGQRSFTPGS